MLTALSLGVLKLLADGEFHSGSQLALDLGVSRGTIWNAVRGLEHAGLEVYRVRGRGYRLAQRVSLLERAAIERHAGLHASLFTVEVIDTAGSTNTVLLARAAAAAATGTVLAAEWQESGRGRMGRVWHSGICGAVTFSLLWRFSHGAGALAGLSLTTGVALVRAMMKLGARDVQLKWPNDVLWRGGKLAGTLIEMQGDALGPSAVVIGIGINVRLSDALRERIDQPTADLEAACGRELDRSAVLGCVLAELAPALEAFEQDGFGAVRHEWERYHAHQGQAVAVKLPDGGVHEGLARGVGDDGALLFETGSGLRRLHSGEIERSTLRSLA